MTDKEPSDILLGLRYQADINPVVPQKKVIDKGVLAEREAEALKQEADSELDALYESILDYIDYRWGSGGVEHARPILDEAFSEMKAGHPSANIKVDHERKGKVVQEAQEVIASYMDIARQ